MQKKRRKLNNFYTLYQNNIYSTIKLIIQILFIPWNYSLYQGKIHREIRSNIKYLFKKIKFKIDNDTNVR